MLPRPDGSFHTDADEWDAAVDRYLALHPGQSIDDEGELAKLRTMLALASIGTAAREPGFGATLLQRLQAEHHARGQRRRSGRRFPHPHSASIVGFLHDPAVADAGTELARTWSGAAFAGRVRAAADTADSDLDLDVLLAAAAGRLSSPT